MDGLPFLQGKKNGFRDFLKRDTDKQGLLETGYCKLQVNGRRKRSRTCV